MLQGMELTRTNRSCGLTTYFFRTLRGQTRIVGATLCTHATFEARREKVKAISYERFPKGS